MILDHMECQNKCFGHVLSSRWPVLALLKYQNALKTGFFATKNGSKMGQKCVFPKMILHHLGCLNKPFLSPLQAILATLESQYALKMGCFGTKNQSKMDQKWVFPKILLDYWGARTRGMSPF